MYNNNELFINTRNQFLNSLQSPLEEQTNVLMEILNTNKNCKYGKKYSFSSINNIKDFQQNVPITDYESYKEYINEIMQGHENVLTCEKILLLEPTSGSTSATKYIPYTKSLQKAFNEGLKPWLSDIFINYPEVMNKQMYWSITPTQKQLEVKSKVKIGFDNDLDYLDSEFAAIIAKNIIIPTNLPQDTDDFQKYMADFLSAHRNLGLISIWNPYLLILFLQKLGDKPEKIWKELDFISCWDEANAELYAEKLKKYFPNTKIQGKGLLATEAIMTIPIENIGKLLCIKSHFFEFQDISTNEIKLINDLELGKDYSIIITTQGGLYRYKIGDIVNVYGEYNDFPLLSFKGRENNTSDYFGEKLSEGFVQNILDKFNIKKTSNFYMFCPRKTENEFCYVLYVEISNKDKLRRLETEIEDELSKNFHYKYARELGQISSFKIIEIENGMKQYINFCIQNGQKLGDIKIRNFTSCINYNFIGKS